MTDKSKRHLAQHDSSKPGQCAHDHVNNTDPTNSNSHYAVIRGEVSAVDAMQIVATLAQTSDAGLERAVYFPYYHFVATARLPALAGKQQASMTCLVDAVNGLGATAAAFSTDDKTLRDTELLAHRTGSEEAARIARRTATHRLSQKLRTIASFELAVIPEGLVYKRFWIVHSGRWRAMVDSTTGRLHPLKSFAA